MQMIAGLSGEMLICRVMVEIVGITEDKEDHGFLETCLVVHPLQGVGVSNGEAIRVPSSQP